MSDDPKFAALQTTLQQLTVREALNILVSDDFDIFSGESGRLSYDGGTVLFTVGLTVSGAGGATGVVYAIVGDATSGILLLNDITGTFANNEVITDSGTGAAVVNGVLGPHAGYWTGFTVVEAAAFTSITITSTAKQNVGTHTFAVNFSTIKDIRALQLASGVIMAHKLGT